MSINNYSEKSVQSGVREILDFLSSMESGDYSTRLSHFEGPIFLNPVIDRLNQLGIFLAAQAQAQAQAQAASESLTEREKMESKFKDANMFIETLIKNSPAGLVCYQSTGNAVAANEAMGRLIGTNAEGLLLQNFRQLESWKRCKLLEMAESALETGLSQREDIHLVSTFGQTVDMDCLLVPFQFKGETHLLFNATDITDRKRLENDLLTAKEAAEKANHTKDLFLATLSHELRTPLTAILSWAQMLKSERLDPSKTKVGLQTIEDAAQTQNQLISDLLDISAIGSGKVVMSVQDIELTEAVNKAITMVRNSAERKSIQLVENLGSEPLFVSGDATRLTQIAWNLVTNSIKFTPPGGRINVTLEILNNSSGPKAQLTVSDTGKGMSGDYLPHVFEQFSQADSSSTRIHRGLGLGLALVQSLVKLHNGTVEAKSDGEGKGSTFIVTLPLIPAFHISSLRCRPLGVATNSVEKFKVGNELSGIQILLVDDEVSVLNSINEMLSSFGAQVRVASSVSEAFAEFKKSVPKVLVSDIGMPMEDGYSLIQKIRKLGRDKGGSTPAVALTAYADSQTRQKVLAAGFQTHVAKPVDSEGLVQTILKTIMTDLK